MSTEFHGTNQNPPIGGHDSVSGYWYVDTSDAPYGIIPSELQIGSYQEYETYAERNQIPVVEDADGAPEEHPDALGSGRRRIGMLVHVQEDGMFYMLIPKGYFGFLP